MKKSALLFLALSLSIFAVSQTVVFHENFELPSQADSLTSTSTGTNAWGINTTFHAGGLRSDSCIVSQGDTTYLTTNAFSTSSNANVILEFAHICKIEFFDAAEIYVSANNGTTWTKLISTQYLGSANFGTAGNKFTSTAYANWQPANNNAIPTNLWWKLEQFDVSSLISNCSQAKIRFVLTDINSSGSAGNYGWLLDNIKVTAAIDELVPPVITLNPPILIDSVFQFGPFNINATITDASGIDTAMLVYTRNNGNPDTVGMINNTGSSFLGIIDTIPAFSLLDTICYYVVAIDSSLVANVAMEPAIGCNQFIIYTSPPPANCTNPITTFPYLQYFDSIPAYTGYPNCSTVHTLPVLSGWTNETGDQTDWCPYSGSTPNNPYTGPSSDHTSGTGNYMYVEATSCYNHTAYLTSACIDITGLGAPTLEFYYHMYGSNMGELHIDIWYGNHWVNDIMTPLSGDQGNQWHKAVVSLIPYKSVTKIRFRAVVGSSYRSDMAIDDVKIWQPPANDAGVLSIDRPVSPAVTGSQSVKATFKNFGSANLTKVKIGWSVDGITQPVYNWSGILTPGTIADSVQIGTFNFQSGASVIKVWAFSPNDSVDGWNPNDTAMSSIIACVGNLRGIFSIGGSSPDFVSFNDALFALSYCGIDSHIVINVYPGTYNEQLLIDSIPGISNSSTVTFQGASNDSTDVVLEHAATGSTKNFVVKLNGVDYITFRKITIKATGSNYAYAIHLTNGAEHNTIENCVVKSMVVNSSYGRGIVLYSGLVNQYNTIKNNVVEGGYYGVYIYGSGSNSRARYNVIEGNDISGFRYYGMMLYYQDSVQVIGNYIHDGVYSTQYGLYTYYIFDGFRIERNIIKLSPSSSGTGMRIYYANYNSYITPTTLAGTVANNFISITSGTSTMYGIYAYYSNKVNYYFNSVNISSGNTSSRALYQGNTTSNAFGQTFINNIFNNSGGGYAAYFNTPATLGTLDYNDYYTTGTKLAFWSGTGDILTLNALKSTSGQETHSLSVNPGFISSTDLHLANTTLAGTGIQVPGIINDIDGDFRNPGAPTIGADELPPVPIDAGVIKVLSPTISEPEGASVTVKVVVRNFGTDTIFGMNVKYYINSGSNINYSYTSTLLPADVDTITFPNITITPGHNHLYAFTTLVNDTNTFNDTLYKYYYGIPILDMGGVELLQPDSGGCFTASETIEVRIKNYGSQAINFVQKPTTINVSVTGPNPTTLTPVIINTGSLAVGATKDVIITSNFNMNQTGIYTFHISTSVSGDGDTSNDTIISKGISVFATVSTFPFIENFENFTTGTGSYNPGTFTNGWSGEPHQNSSVYQWKVNSGTTSSSGTGPANDHTLGTGAGKYLYTEANYGLNGSIAKLISPCIDLSSMTNPSIRFYYHMFGSQCFTIRVDILYNGAWTTSVGYVIGQQQSSETDAWKQKVVDLSGYNGIVRIRFRAVKGGGYYGDMAIDDIYIYEPIQKDVGITGFVKPTAAFSSVGTSEQVEVTIENFGLDTLKSMNIGYVAGNSTPVIQSWTGSLPRYQSTTFAFQAPYFSTAGQVNLCAFTMLPGDGNTNNDTSCIDYTGIPVFPVPYSDDFEGINYFVNDGGLKQWEHGSPGGTTINTPHSPTNVWMTKLNANYENNSFDYLFSPFFDFTYSTNATLSFWNKYDTQSGSDGGCIQYSLNGGQTWSTLGSQGDSLGTNWYTSTIGGTPSWSGQQNTWIKSSYNLSQFNNYYSPIQFRYVFFSNNTTNNYDGWAIDDFSISLPQIPFDAGITEIIEPSSYTTPGSQVQVKIKIENFGSNTLTSIPLEYKVNNGTPVSDTWTGNLATGNTVIYTFTTTFTAPTSYEVCAYTKVTNDTYTFNDKSCKSISNDVGITYIIEPATHSIINTDVNIIARIKNYGNETLTNFDVNYQVNTTPVVTEAWTGNLTPGNNVDYTFTTPYTSPMGMYNLCVFTNLSGDTGPGNDKLCKYVTGTAGVKDKEPTELTLGQNIPNPATGITLIPFTVPGQGNIYFTIRNIVGQKLFTQNHKVPAGKHQVEIDISNMPAGIYFYSIEFNGKRLVKKMIVN